MKSKVYIETTIVSYLMASPTSDIIQSAHQEITRQWWAERARFDDAGMVPPIICTPEESMEPKS